MHQSQQLLEIKRSPLRLLSDSRTFPLICCTVISVDLGMPHSSVIVLVVLYCLFTVSFSVFPLHKLELKHEVGRKQKLARWSSDASVPEVTSGKGLDVDRYPSLFEKRFKVAKKTDKEKPEREKRSSDRKKRNIQSHQDDALEEDSTDIPEFNAKQASEAKRRELSLNLGSNFIKDNPFLRMKKDVKRDSEGLLKATKRKIKGLYSEAEDTAKNIVKNALQDANEAKDKASRLLKAARKKLRDANSLRRRSLEDFVKDDLDDELEYQEFDEEEAEEYQKGVSINLRINIHSLESHHIFLNGSMSNS